MSSPPPASAEASRPTEDPNDVDAEMEDATQDATNPSTAEAGAGAGAENSQGANTSAGAANDRSSTIDNDPSQTLNTQTQSTNLPSQSRKDVTLREFLSKMDEYAPIIPDAVTAHYLTLAGLPPPSQHDPSGASTGTTPLPLARLLALATQKFVADIAADAYQYSRIRASNTSGGAGGGALGMGMAGVGMPGVVGGPSGGAGASGGVGGGTGKGGAQSTALGVQRAGFGGGGQGGSGQGKTVLTMEDLGMAVQEYGVNVKRGEFYR